jgi:hypothetical protein
MLWIVLGFGDVEIAVINPQQMGLASAPHFPNVLDCREYWVRLGPRTRNEKLVSSHRIQLIRQRLYPVRKLDATANIFGTQDAPEGFFEKSQHP